MTRIKFNQKSNEMGLSSITSGLYNGKVKDRTLFSKTKRVYISPLNLFGNFISYKGKYRRQ